jgi:hypothetical protein
MNVFVCIYGKAYKAPENTKNRKPFLQSYRSLHEKNSSSTITHLTGIAYTVE